ncbi:MAG TPA: M6 family metalloprotease domain-containing protein [Ignavibacteriales bacterium]|nr:M6 family metalloprotease domain-containing protein [Ignavibacteriales bacterium]
MRKLFLAIFIIAFELIARPAKPTIINYQQSTGETVQIRILGDENFHYIKSLDGYTLLHNSKGDLEYAIADQEGNLHLSGILAKNIAQRTIEEISFLNQNGTNKVFSKLQKKYLAEVVRTKRKIANRFLKSNNSAEVKLPVLLIEYPDKKFTYTVQDFEMLMNQANYGGIGCVKDYYSANSFGKLVATSIVSGIFKAKNNLSYYGANDSYGYDVRPQYLVREAVDSAYNYGLDFSQFDNDKDGYVDVVIVIFAGYGEDAGANSNTLWSHSWYLSGDPSDDKSVTYNGVKIDNYTIQPELEGASGSTICGIGGIVHEFGHALGLPDWYDADYDEPSTGGQAFDLGYWDVMAAGCWNNDSKTPSNHGAYSKILLGWQETNLLDKDTTISLPNANDNNISYKYYTGAKGEFFILENRQQVGWDAYIPGHGLLIYHVDSLFIEDHWGDNSINVNPAHQGLDLEEADNIKNENTYEADPFPGTANKKEFSDKTTPSAKAWNGALSRKKVYNIQENNNIITFNFMLDTTTSNSTQQKLVITEVADNKTYQEEYIEIFNYGSSSIDLTGIVVKERYSNNNTSERSITLAADVQLNPNANTILYPGEYAIIVRPDAKFNDFKTKYNLIDTIAYFSKASSLPQINGDERYQLLTLDGDIIDQFGVWEYSTTSDFRVKSGNCYERKNYLITGDIDSAWAVTSNSSYQYTPGAPNKTTVVSVENKYDNLTFKLIPNYPNPFNPTTTISFVMPKAGNAIVKVFNSLGQEVSTLLNGRIEAGIQQLQLNAVNLSSGVYYYTITTDFGIKTAKMMLVK